MKELQSRKNTNNTISKKTDTKNDISNNNLNTNNNEENELIDIKKNQTYNPRMLLTYTLMYIYNIR